MTVAASAWAVVVRIGSVGPGIGALGIAVLSNDVLGNDVLGSAVPVVDVLGAASRAACRALRAYERCAAEQ